MNLYALPNYQNFRLDRIGQTSGGLLLYADTASVVNARRLSHLKTSNEDLLVGFTPDERNQE